jgi:hypothetical protein
MPYRILIIFDPANPARQSYSIIRSECDLGIALRRATEQGLSTFLLDRS